jgi:hypothetical protein
MVKSILQPMNKTFTPNDLILLAYNETGNKKTGEIIEALNKDEELLDEYHSILNVRNILDDLYQEPAEPTISTILNYSKALNVFKLKPAVNTVFFIVN